MIYSTNGLLQLFPPFSKYKKVGVLLKSNNSSLGPSSERNNFSLFDYSGLKSTIIIAWLVVGCTILGFGMFLRCIYF